MTDLAELCAGVRAGSEAASSEIYDLIRRPVLAYAARNRRSDGEDILQITAMRVLMAIKLGRLLDPEKFIGYSVQIAKRVILDDLRKHRRVVSIDEAGTLSELAEFEKQDLLRRLVEALPRLRPIEAELIRRYDFAGETMHEIAEALGLTSRYVKLTRWHGVQKLKRHFQNQPQRRTA